MSKPIDRAAEAMHQLSNSDPWDREHPYLRCEYRDDANAAFESIDVDELALVVEQATAEWWSLPADPLPPFREHVARAVRTYLLTDGVPHMTIDAP